MESNSSIFENVLGSFGQRIFTIIQIRANWNKPTKRLTINDMVLVKDDNLTRLQWKLGRVTEVYTGRDGVVHSAKIKLSETTLTRPANKLCILENVK